GRRGLGAAAAARQPDTGLRSRLTRNLWTRNALPGRFASTSWAFLPSPTARHRHNCHHHQPSGVSGPGRLPEVTGCAVVDARQEAAELAGCAQQVDPGSWRVGGHGAEEGGSAAATPGDQPIPEVGAFT